MTTVSWIALVVALAAAGTDWWAVGRDDRRLERLAKPLALVGVIVVAATLVPLDERLRWTVVVALCFGLVGDVMLMLDRFVPGALAFAVGHAVYLVAFVPLAHPPIPLALAAVAGLVLLAVPGPRVVRGARAKSSVLAGIVAVYEVLLAGVLVAGAGAGNAVLATGVVLFTVSDLLNGWRRFVGETPGGRVVIHATYHLGQLLIALSLLSLTP